MISGAAADMMRQPLLLTVETAGPHRFTYTKYELDSGKAVWRWPQAPQFPVEAISPTGQLLDVTV